MKDSFFVSLLKKIREIGKLAKLGEETFKFNQTIKPLMSAIPQGKRYKKVRSMATVLVSAFVSGKTNVNNFKLAQCLGIKFADSNPKMTRKKYKDEVKFPKYNQKIENCLYRTLNKYWGRLGYYVQFGKESSRLIKLP